MEHECVECGKEIDEDEWDEFGGYCCDCFNPEVHESTRLL